MAEQKNFTPSYSPWRHGGWYTNVRHQSGASGCVSRNYPDKKWRIVCDPRPSDHTYKSRDEATYAEYLLSTDPDYIALLNQRYR